MATQSLYRRYRPRRFAEIKGQQHVVRALRDAVAGGREGQAYLFSGPRGTGKTTSARILAKVLNCERPVDGEPCCECQSCLDVERGVSYDVHELDAASNNGVDAMRDLIEKANLGTPGRHKVYILDEVHMLSKPAEATLLKTLEEPPAHVVFVLATTDPQKVSDTIRSRTQHLRFHLLPPDTLAEHVRWVAADAGLDVGDDAVAAAVSQGAGSARDALSALELIANAGGSIADLLRFDEIVEAMIDQDTGRALTAMAQLANAGHDARTIAEELVKHLRNGFLALMAPDLVQLPSAAVSTLTDQAQRLGAARLVAAVERFGQLLIELRHAPDPRVLVEVALVLLTRPAAESGGAGAEVAALAARLAQLEQAVAAGATTAARAASVEPAGGRAKLGGRAQATTDTAPAASAEPAAAPPAQPASATVAPAPPEPAAAAQAPAGDPAREWADSVRPSLRGLVRALYAPVELVSFRDGVATLSAPNAAHQTRCAEHEPDVRQAWHTACGRQVTIAWDAGGGATTDPPVAPPSAPAATTESTAPSPGAERPPAAGAAGDAGAHDDHDEPDESRPAVTGAASVLDRVAEAFPGAERIETAERTDP